MIVVAVVNDLSMLIVSFGLLPVLYVL